MNTTQLTPIDATPFDDAEAKRLRLDGNRAERRAAKAAHRKAVLKLKMPDGRVLEAKRDEFEAVLQANLRVARHQAAKARKEGV